VLEGSPTCRVPTGGRRGGAYYEAAFERLLGLAARDVHVREVACQAVGAPACRFTIHLGRRP
jgi:predicted hydrocarbon binding protein